MSGLGKFEGEPHWVELLWDRALSGFSDKNVCDGSLVIEGFALTAEIASLTGYDENPFKYVCLWENDQGFVSHTVLTETQLDECEGMDVDWLDEPTSEYYVAGVDEEWDELGGET
jgi:hypothetical protein